MPIELIHAAEYPQCRIHYIKSETTKPPLFSRVKPTFPEAQNVRLVTIEQLRNLWKSDNNVQQLINDNTDPGQAEIITPSARGDWIKAIPALIDRGFTMISVLLTREQDESRSSSRMCIPVPGQDVIFVPNYKCGYSSMCKYVADLMSEDQPEPLDLELVEREKIDLFTLHREQKRIVSIVRDPKQRFFSFYKEKITRPKNFPLYGEPIQRIYGKCNPITVLKFISDMPDEFRDPHVKSQYGNLFSDSTCLVDEWYRLEELTTDFASHLGLPGHFPHVLKTRGPSTSHDEEMTHDLVVLLSSIYNNDYLTFGYEPPAG